MNRKALGKGLGALIPDFERGVPETPAPQTGTTELLIDEIAPNPLQPRKFFDEDKLTELVQSIKENGVLQPVIVQKIDSGYELVVGERRWRASKRAGLKKIPVVIRDYSDTQSLEVALIENLHRQDLNPIEEAEGYWRLANEFGLTQEKISEQVGKNRASIANSLRLLKLSKVIKEDIIAGRLSAGHARGLLSLESDKDIETLRREILKKDLNVRQVESRARQMKKPPARASTDSGEKKDIFLKNLETELSRALGTKVDITPGKKGGKLVVTYYTNEDLDRIREIIVSKNN
jgi:ParB family chromosome partitioning protein